MAYYAWVGNCIGLNTYTVFTHKITEFLHFFRVFANSPIFKRLRHMMDVPVRFLAESFTILADKAFPLCPEIMTPYKKDRDTPLTEKQWVFNMHMNSKRQVLILRSWCRLSLK